MHLLIGEGRRPTGMSPTKPPRPRYGAVGHCVCGERFRSNEAPSKGGRVDVRRQFAAHVAKMNGGV